MVVAVPTMVTTGDGESGFDSGEGMGKERDSDGGKLSGWIRGVEGSVRKRNGAGSVESRVTGSGRGVVVENGYSGNGTAPDLGSAMVGNLGVEQTV